MWVDGSVVQFVVILVVALVSCEIGAALQRKADADKAEEDYMLGNLDPDIRRAVENSDNP